MNKYIKIITDKLIFSGSTPETLALSFCMGVFTAIAPIIPLQTPVLILLNYIFGFNQTIAISVLYIVNNPITLAPIYAADYFFGKYLFKLLDINLLCYNPAWATKFSLYIGKWIDTEKYFGSHIICIWDLLLGGLLLGAIISIILYPIALYIFKKIFNKHLAAIKHENSHTK